MRVLTNHKLRVASLLAGALLLAGCSRSMLTAPEAGPTSATTAERDVSQVPPPANLLGGVLGGVIDGVNKVLNWTTVVQKLVLKDQSAVVTGHRWTLQFAKGSLSSDALITIQDYDADVLDVQFGPSGTKFLVPVTLTVDFSNTAADPGVAHSDGREPVLYWLNDQTGDWVEMPGRVDWASKQLIVQLPHFSRYVVGSKAGWKSTPPRDND
jgi:hypothetical protein